jgi:GT2 family glycosyltransferase
VDGSVEMVRRDFPSVHIIENHENVGFAKANNQALASCTGQYLLLLNPDTVVESDTFVKCVDFMQSHADCGGLCVKMVDGEGNYLKESKRGFPSPEASFYKMSGLIHLFPHSKRIGAYYMGHLSEDEVNEVEIMPGAFLLFRREVYEKIGGLDESYFMYGGQETGATFDKGSLAYAFTFDTSVAEDAVEDGGQSVMGAHVVSAEASGAANSATDPSTVS